MITGTITSKGQITIPKKIREFLKVENSDEIVFVPIEDGKVLITTKKKPSSVLFGMMKHRKLSQPVPVEKMKSAIRKRRQNRGR